MDMGEFLFSSLQFWRLCHEMLRHLIFLQGLNLKDEKIYDKCSQVYNVLTSILKVSWESLDIVLVRL